MEDQMVKEVIESVDEFVPVVETGNFIKDAVIFAVGAVVGGVATKVIPATVGKLKEKHASRKDAKKLDEAVVLSKDDFEVEPETEE